MSGRRASFIMWLATLSLVAGVLTVALAHNGSEAASATHPPRAYLPLVACDSCTNTSPSPTPTATPTRVAAQTWYTSSHHSAQYYYCDLDDGWRNLSPVYIRSYPSEAALLAVWGGQRTKHPDSKC
ncbi:MAG: hypothetical protein M0R74_14920 [Dehalococcoidia bacterium]|nr:hypothetical protein [Dehalococcoidia bacterium]